MLNAKLKDPRFDYFRFDIDMPLDDVIEFVDDYATVCIDSDGVQLAYEGPYSEEHDRVTLDHGDVLIVMFGELEVLTPETFEEYFEV